LHDLEINILQSRIFSFNCLPSTSELYTAPKLSLADFSFSQSGLSHRPWTSTRKPNLDRKS